MLQENHPVAGLLLCPETIQVHVVFGVGFGHTYSTLIGSGLTCLPES